jgi:hypothetical protein
MNKGRGGSRTRRLSLFVNWTRPRTLRRIASEHALIGPIKREIGCLRPLFVFERAYFFDLFCAWNRSQARHAGQARRVLDLARHGSGCPVLGSLVPSGIHRTCRIVAGLAACSASLPRKSKHGHTWPPPRACVETVQDRPESANVLRVATASSASKHRERASSAPAAKSEALRGNYFRQLGQQAGRALFN